MVEPGSFAEIAVALLVGCVILIGLGLLVYGLRERPK